MEKIKVKTITARAYFVLSCYRKFSIKSSKKYEESLLLFVTNNGGDIDFTFTNKLTNQVYMFENPETGQYIIPLNKGDKLSLVIKAKKAKGSYKIQRKIIKPIK